MTQIYSRGCPPLEIPTLETARLVLRPFRLGDEADLARIHGDDVVVRFIGGTPDATLTGAVDKILAYLGHWAARGCGKWAVTLKGEDRVIGRTGYGDFPHEWPGLELGWTFGREAWGKGYATEAARAAMRWGFETLRPERIMSMIHPENIASQAVAGRLGEAPWKAHDHEGVPHTLWAMTRAEWLSRGGAA